MKPDLLLLIITILVALTFDFLNGFHDAANSIATVVSTRVLSPKLAVVWAAFFNFVAAFLLGTAVAKTIGGGMIRIDECDPVCGDHGPVRRHRLGPADLVVGTADFLFPRLDRWLCRSGGHAIRMARDYCRGLVQDPDLHRGGPGHGTHSWA